MAIHKHVKSQSKETIIFDIYQLNPSFYKKIISRRSSFRFTHQNSFKSYSGKVPFIWEIQPGTPRADDISIHDQTVKPIRFPPAIYSLTVPKPSIPPSGAKAYFLKNLKKMKNNVHIQVPKIVLHKPNPNPTIKNMKVYFLKNMKKVEKIKNGMAKKAKPPAPSAASAGGVLEADEKMNKSDSDGFESSYSDFDDFTPSYKTSGYSTPSMFESSSPRSFSFKSPTMLHFRSLQKGLLKWSFLKRDNGK